MAENDTPPSPPRKNTHTRARTHEGRTHGKVKKGNETTGKETKKSKVAARTPFGPAPLTTVAEPVKMASLSYGVDRYPFDVTSTPFQMATLGWLSGGCQAGIGRPDQATMRVGGAQARLSVCAELGIC